jgi:PIN domain nuclease of toxin-antitoxin system
VTKGLLLDTCAVIWLLRGDTLRGDAQERIAAAQQAGTVWVSPISAWELATLERKGRLILTVPAREAFAIIAARTGIQLASLNAETLLRAAELNSTAPNDPADRIIIATARSLDLAVVTRDRPILDYAGAGHLEALAC